MCILCRVGENPNFLFLGLSAQRALSKMVSPLGIQLNGSFFVNSGFLSLRKEESYGQFIRPVQKKASDLFIPKEQIVVLHSHMNKTTIQ